LVNNAINTAAAAAALSNPASSLPQSSSSSTFNLGPYNQPDIYRIEEIDNGENKQEEEEKKNWRSNWTGL
jgi:hypothetical protein